MACTDETNLQPRQGSGLRSGLSLTAAAVVCFHLLLEVSPPPIPMSLQKKFPGGLRRSARATGKGRTDTVCVNQQLGESSAVAWKAHKRRFHGQGVLTATFGVYKALRTPDSKSFGKRTTQYSSAFHRTIEACVGLCQSNRQCSTRMKRRVQAS